MGPLMIRSFFSEEGITRNGSYVKNRNFIFEMVQPTRPSFGQAPGWVEEEEEKEEEKATGWLATFPWNTDIHGRSIEKRGKARKRGFLCGHPGSFAT